MYYMILILYFGTLIPALPMYYPEPEELEYAALYQSCKVIKKDLEHNYHGTYRDEEIKKRLIMHLTLVNTITSKRLLDDIKKRNFVFLY
jgi:hypothetical protein